MHGAGHTWIKGMDGAQNFDWLFRVHHGRANQRSLIGSSLAMRIPWACVPSRRNNRLVVRDLAVFDMHPMSKRPTWCLMEAKSKTFTGPCAWVPVGCIVNRQIATAHILFKLGEPARQLVDQPNQTRVECRWSPAKTSSF